MSMDTLDDLAAAGYCTDEWARWQQGGCDSYAAALIQARPHLRAAMAGYTYASMGYEGTGWLPAHMFAHDGEYAYDSAGRHKLPYHGVHGDLDYVVLDLGADDLESEPAEIPDALAHAERNGILALIDQDLTP